MLQRSEEKIRIVRAQAIHLTKNAYEYKLKYWIFSNWKKSLSPILPEGNGEEIISFTHDRQLKKTVFNLWKERREEEHHARRVGDALSRAATELKNALAQHNKLKNSRNVIVFINKRLNFF